jgi:hypothetical protein
MINMQNCSQYTSGKEVKFKEMVDWHSLKVPNRYLYVDTHAGPGRWEFNGRKFDGSPVLAEKVLAKNKADKSSILCFEQDYKSWVDLKVRMGSINVLAEVMHGHNGIVQSFIRHRPKRPRKGLLYSDATGIPNFQDLNKLYAEFPQYDVLVHMSGIAMMRFNAAWPRKAVSLEPTFETRRHWFVSQPQSRWRWVFMFGSNQIKKAPDLKHMDLKSVDSAEGRKNLKDMVKRLGE